MTHSKWMISLLTAMTFCVVAEPQRTVFTQENKFPRWEQVEAGVDLRYNERDQGFIKAESVAAVPYLRYGLMENLALTVGVPFANVDNGMGDSESGVGDTEVKLQLRAYEDIFGYPYFIPHVSATLPTGDDEKGLGTGETIVTAGISYGDKMYDFLTYVLDGSYRIRPDKDNQIILSSSLIWHVSEELDFLGEFRWQDKDGEFEDSSTMYVLGGMVYNWTRKLQMGVYAGATFSGDDETIAKFRLSYSF